MNDEYLSSLTIGRVVRRKFEPQSLGHIIGFSTAPAEVFVLNVIVRWADSSETSIHPQNLDIL
jgi:hypothetical protein